MKPILIAAILFSGSYSFASTPAGFVSADTAINPRSYALTQDQFLADYGRDDSSKALINFFFQKRSKGQTIFGAGAAVTVLAGVGLGVAVNQTNKESDDLGNELASIFAVIIAGIALGAGIALAAVGTALWGRYSRKRLLALLDNYSAGKSIPGSITRNIMFRSFVQYGEWDSETRRKLRSADRVQKTERRRR
jgi:hypothetical protein